MKTSKAGSQTPGKLAGKVSIITGGNGGIGEAIAKLFAAEGSKVVITGRRPAECERVCEDIAGTGGEADFFAGDVSKESDVEAMIKKATDSFGRIDCAVNNASVEGGMKPLIETTEDDWNFAMNINLKGVFFCLKYQALAMKESGGGSIVNIGSVNSMIGGAGISPYVTSKHGLLGLTKCASAEFTAFGVRVNAVCPGIIATPMHDRLKEVAGADAYQAYFDNRTHLKRAGTPKEIAHPVLWLCSPESTYITGTTLTPDGGMLAS